jgi:hypothetical protein
MTIAAEFRYSYLLFSPPGSFRRQYIPKTLELLQNSLGSPLLASKKEHNFHTRDGYNYHSAML